MVTLAVTLEVDFPSFSFSDIILSTNFVFRCSTLIVFKGYYSCLNLSFLMWILTASC